jgi:hypothetical protein
MKRFVMLVLLILIFPAEASALHVTNRDGTPAPLLQRWANKSSIQLFDLTMTVHRDCDGWAGCFAGGTEIGIEGADPETFFHEYTHMWDDLTDDEVLVGEDLDIVRVTPDPRAEYIRQRFRKIMKLPQDWGKVFRIRACHGLSIWEGCGTSAMEMFAEAGAFCMAYPRSKWHRLAYTDGFGTGTGIHGSYGYFPTGRQHMSVCRLMLNNMGNTQPVYAPETT